MKYKVIEKENVTLYANESIMVRNKSTGLIGRLTIDIDECPESGGGENCSHKGQNNPDTHIYTLQISFIFHNYRHRQ